MKQNSVKSGWESIEFHLKEAIHWIGKLEIQGPKFISNLKTEETIWQE